MISHGEQVIKRTGSHSSGRKMETFLIHYWWACLASIDETELINDLFFQSQTSVKAELELF